MKKYKIYLTGRGCDLYLYPLDEEKKNKIKEFELTSPDFDFEQVAPILGSEWPSDTEISYMGTYNDPDNYLIIVEDENGKVIWESPQELSITDGHFQSVHSNEDIFVIEDYAKGSFFTFNVELEEDFNHEKLNTKVLEVADIFEIVVGLIYDDLDLEDFKDFDDTWSKGFSYYLCTKSLT